MGYYPGGIEFVPRARNPAGLIPALETPDGVMFETAAILLWLADRHGTLAPPVASTERAMFLSWLFYASNTLHITLRQTFYPAQYVGDDAGAATALRQKSRQNLRRSLALFETLAADGHDWFAASAPSVLDFYVATCLRWMAIYPRDDHGWFDPSHWPRLHDMARTLETRASVRAVARAEGLGNTVFSAPRFPTPPEGSPT